jgi:hypothetical protein
MWVDVNHLLQVKREETHNLSSLSFLHRCKTTGVKVFFSTNGTMTTGFSQAKQTNKLKKLDTNLTLNLTQNGS